MPITAFRLPADHELREQAVAGALAHRLPDSVTCLWTEPAELAWRTSTPGLWIRPGKPHPHTVTGEVILQAIQSDTCKTEILAQIRAAVTLDTTLTTLILLGPAQRSADQLAGLHRSAGGIELTRAELRGLGINGALEYFRMMGGSGSVKGIVRRADRRYARELDQASDFVRADSGLLAHAHPPGREDTCPLNRLHAIHAAIRNAAASTSDPDPDRAVNRAIGLTRALALDSASTLGMTPKRSQDAIVRAIGEEFIAYGWRKINPESRDGMTGTMFNDLTIRLLEVPGIPLMWVSRGPLGRAWRQSPEATGTVGEAGSTFAGNLVSAAGISRATEITASPDSVIAEILSNRPRIGPPLRIDAPPRFGAQWDFWRAGSQLADIVMPLISGTRPADDPRAAALRSLALAMAADSAGNDHITADVCRALAATITLLQQRDQGQATAGEAIVLAFT